MILSARREKNLSQKVADIFSFSLAGATGWQMWTTAMFSLFRDASNPTYRCLCPSSRSIVIIDSPVIMPSVSSRRKLKNNKIFRLLSQCALKANCNVQAESVYQGEYQGGRCISRCQVHIKVQMQAQVVRLVVNSAFLQSLAQIVMMLCYIYVDTLGCFGGVPYLQLVYKGISFDRNLFCDRNPDCSDGSDENICSVTEDPNRFLKNLKAQSEAI